MHRFKPGLLILLLVATSVGEPRPAYGAQTATEPSCWDLAQTQRELEKCAAADYEVADRELNEVYAKVLAGAGPAEVSAIRKAQRAWIAFRDAEVQTLYSDPGKGSVTSMCAGILKTQLTRQRTEELKRRLQRREGEVCQTPGEDRD